ncbi:hypothetical protein P0Y35_15105 [Kiritimatiellaeota bacterium B1221]|nr:hypothetical protein [Kiritimatiellaeota bacterium B1221]
MYKKNKIRTTSTLFGLLIWLSLLTACGKKPLPLSAESVSMDTQLLQALCKGLQTESPSPGALWIVMPPPLSQREGEKDRSTTLLAAAQKQLPDWQIQIIHPSESDLQRYESQLYGGDFPVSMLRNLIQSDSPPTAIFCFKGVPTGSQPELQTLSREFTLGGVATYGEQEADPLLRIKVLRVAAISDHEGISWKTSKDSKWIPFRGI